MDLARFRVPLLLALALLGAGLWWAHAHRSKRSVIAALSFGSSIDTLNYEGQQYTATWTEPKTFTGTVQWTGTASAHGIPFLTHEVLITTGDYSDPAVVKLEPVVDHETTWRYPAGRTLDGTIYVVHCIPATPAIYDTLETLRVGDTIDIEGEVAKGPIRGANGGSWETSKPTHPTVFVRDVRRSAAGAGGP
jgi:hypothetical protein